MKTEKVIGIIITTIIAVSMILTLMSCGVHKNTTTTRGTTDSLVEREREKFLHQRSELIQMHEKELKEARSNTVTFEDAIPCPDVVIDAGCNDDSLVKIIRQLEARLRDAKNTIRMNADGSIDAQGRIRSANATADKWSREVDSLGRRNDSLVKENENLKAQVSKKQVTSHTVKTRININWLLLAIAFVAGCLFWKNKDKLTFIKHKKQQL